MTPVRVEITDIRFRRPGLNKISFRAYYDGYIRKGTVVFDTKHGVFRSHNADLGLLSKVCVGLQSFKRKRVA